MGSWRTSEIEALRELRDYAAELADTRAYQFNAEFHAVVHAILQATHPSRFGIAEPLTCPVVSSTPREASE